MNYGQKDLRGNIQQYLQYQTLNANNSYLKQPRSIATANITERLSSLNNLIDNARDELNYNNPDTSKLKIWLEMGLKEEKALFDMLHHFVQGDPNMTAKIVQLDALAKKRIQIERMVEHIALSRNNTFSNITTLKNFNDKLHRKYNSYSLNEYNSNKKLVIAFDYLYDLPDTYYSFYLTYYLIDTNSGKLLSSTDRTTAVMISKMRNNAVINAVEHIRISNSSYQALYIEVIGIPYARQDQSMGIGWTMLPVSILNDFTVQAPVYSSNNTLKRSSSNILSKSNEQLRNSSLINRDRLSENVGKFKLPFYHYPIKYVSPYADFKYNNRVGKLFLFIQSKGALGSDFASQEDLRDLMEKNNRGFAHMSYSIPAIHAEREFEHYQDEKSKLAKDNVELTDENKRLNKLLDNQQKKLEDLLAIENNEVGKILKGEKALVNALKRNPFEPDDEDSEDEDDNAKMARWRAYDTNLTGLSILLINMTNHPNGHKVRIISRVVFQGQILEDDLYQKMQHETVKLKPEQQKKKFTVPIDQDFKIAACLNKLLEIYAGENIYLEFDILHKNKLVAWSTFELGEAYNERFVLKTGIHAAQLYSGKRKAYPFKKKKAKQIADYFIHFKLSEFQYKREKMQAYVMDPIKEENEGDESIDENGSNNSINGNTANVDKTDELNQENNNDAYIINKNKTSVKTPFTNGGIDIYIDQLRFLPDNVAVSKILARVVDDEFNDLITPMSLHPQGNSDHVKPIFDDKIEVRLKEYSVPMFLIVAILCIEESDSTGEIKILGYAYHPLFLSIQDDKPSNPASVVSYLNNGNFQIPIYHLGYNTIFKEKINLQNLNKLERITALTILCRINRAVEEGNKILNIDSVSENELESKKVLVKFKGYSQGKYYFPNQPNSVEDELYHYRDARLNYKCKDKSIEVLHKLGIDINSDEIEDDVVYELEQVFSKPKTRNDFRFNFHGFQKYTQTVGFSIAIDGIFQTKKRGFYIVMFGINPPGGFYKEVVSSENTYFVSEIDWDSSSSGMLAYNSKYTSIKQIPFNPNAHIIFTIKEVVFNKKREPVIKDFGFSILPLFSQDEYVYSGAYQLPVFKGDLDAASVATLQNGDPFDSLLESAIKNRSSKRILKPLDLTSLVIRLKDNFLGSDMFQYRFDIGRINTDFLPKNKINKYVITSKSYEREKNKESLRGMCLKNVDTDDMNYILSQVVYEAYGLTNI